ncbi:hypothetical protein FA95DRAFT_1611727 [Auriscalpium vulgare]|uniref:Uncharacterized protein n=1 Tax=Auriscalpium vulgare TaxID=40419 RepID=A0ACB8R937_9AGAM|nr:hypothetical protein FA95DRAFT_1611727 [Auriscalpium vulgare]
MPAALPVEISLLIVKNVSSTQDLRSLRTVDRAFCAVTTPRLPHPDLASYVREVVYRDSTVDENGNEVDPADRDDRPSPDAGYDTSIEEPLVGAFSLAAQLPDLTSIRLVFDPNGPNDIFDEVNSYNMHGETGAPLRLQRALVLLGTLAPARRVCVRSRSTSTKHSAHVAYSPR